MSRLFASFQSPFLASNGFRNYPEMRVAGDARSLVSFRNVSNLPDAVGFPNPQWQPPPLLTLSYSRRCRNTHDDNWRGRFQSFGQGVGRTTITRPDTACGPHLPDRVFLHTARWLPMMDALFGEICRSMSFHLHAGRPPTPPPFPTELIIKMCATGKKCRGGRIPDSNTTTGPVR